MKFDVIPYEQTPLTPEITDLKLFIESNKEKFSAYLEYFNTRTRDAIGLAANQCSIDGERFNVRAIIVMDAKTRKITLAIDPKIIQFRGIKRNKHEGCLTWRGKTIIAERNFGVDVEYYDIEGVLHKETHLGFQSQVWQHEINHINGVKETVVEKIYTEFNERFGRNDNCPCGSGKKFKKCCENILI